MIGINSKLFSIMLFSLLGVSGLLYILFAFEVIGESLMLNWCFLLLIVAGLVAVVFPVIGMVKDFQKAKNSLIGTGALIVIFFIGYAMSSDEVYKMGERVVDGGISKWSEAGLITFYSMIILAVLAIVYTEISKAFK